MKKECIMNDNVMLTVKMLAYNHGKYIAQAIESIVSQKTEYKFELLIGEDCSTDNTRGVIQRYQEAFPHIIRVVYHQTNQGCTMNSYSLDLEAKGKYIAGCEGDDFWCDDTRIQRDVDFLEEHPEYVGVCHKCKIVDENGVEIDENDVNVRNRFWTFDKEVFTLSDYEQWRTPGHGSAQTRRNVMKENDLDYSIVYKASKRVGDRSHLLIHIVEGDIFCMKDIVSCYRFRMTASSNNFMSVQKQKNLKDEDFLMMIRLQEWAWNNKKIKLNLESVKKDRLIAATVIQMKDPSDENKKVLKIIIDNSGSKLTYLLLAMKVYIIKSFYWKILKKDKIIKV